MLQQQYYKSEPTQRQLRIGKMILQAVSSAMEGIISDPLAVTFNGVCMSGDLKRAKFFFSSTMNDKIDAVQQELNSMQGYFRKIIAEEIKMKYVPEIFFIHDTITDKVLNIESILDQISK